MDDKTKPVNDHAGAESGLNVGLERLRTAAGIELEDSYEAGSKWQVGDKELADLVRLAKEEERDACAKICRDMELDMQMPSGNDCANAILERSNV